MLPWGLIHHRQWPFQLSWSPPQALSPAEPPAANALPAAAAAAAARLATPAWQLAREAMAATAHFNAPRCKDAHPGSAANAAGGSAELGQGAAGNMILLPALEARQRCARFQQRLAAAGDERLLRAWLPPAAAARFMAPCGGGAAREQRKQLLLQVRRPAIL